VDTFRPFFIYIYYYPVVGQLDCDVLGSHAGSRSAGIQIIHLWIKIEGSRFISRG
jgi:hypothetical protein